MLDVPADERQEYTPLGAGTQLHELQQPLLQWRAVAYEQGDGGMATVTVARGLHRRVEQAQVERQLRRVGEQRGRSAHLVRVRVRVRV